jgi:thiol-disulfide isomerase/thioredoxin
MLTNFKHPALPYLLVIGGAILIFIWARSAKGLSMEGFSSAAGNEPDYHFFMYYADWCPHCVSAKPEFKKLKDTQVINGKTIKMHMINSETQADQVLEKVTGYPTIRLYDAKKALIDEYGKDRTYDGFMGYLETKIPKAKD